MSDPKDPKDASPLAPEAPEAGPAEALSDEDMKSLLRGALGQDAAPRGDVLRGVQQKIRQRSRGKFYDEGWSTAEHPPVYTYLLTAALMLAVLFLIYAVLVPTSGEPLPVTNEPAPVQIIAPKR
jgi:hypothetical protein